MFTDFHRDGVGVTVGHESAGGSGSSHAEASGVVDDDHVRSTLLDELGGDAGSGTGNDEGFSPIYSVLKSVSDFLS